MTLLLLQLWDSTSDYQSQRFQLLIFVVEKTMGVKFNEQFNVWTVLMSNAIPGTVQLIPAPPWTNFSIIFWINAMHRWRYFRLQDTGCKQMCPHLCDSSNAGENYCLVIWITKCKCLYLLSHPALKSPQTTMPGWKHAGYCPQNTVLHSSTPYIRSFVRNKWVLSMVRVWA